MINIEKYRALPKIRDAIYVGFVEAAKQHSPDDIMFERSIDIIYQNVRLVAAAHFEESRRKTKSPSYPGLLRNLFKGMF